jgi:hypothetical protein
MALVVLFASYASYSRLEDGRAYMRSNAANFQATGDFVVGFHTSHQRYPTREELVKWARSKGYGKWADALSGGEAGGSSVACTNAQPEEGFTLPASDTYIVERWRGEWFDCYGVPSGANNIVHDLPGDDLRYHLMLWLIAITLLFLGWRLAPFHASREGSLRNSDD